MIKKILYTCEIFIIGAILFMAGHLYSFSKIPPPSFEISLFELQNRYSEKIQKNLEAFLEPIVGAGNVKVFAQIRLFNNTHKIQKKSPLLPSLITDLNQGIILDQQNISLILNTTSSVSQNIFEDLVSNALGIRPDKGDTLSIQILPFKEIAPLTFGLSHLTLIRIAGILISFLFFSFILLMILYFKENKLDHLSLLSGISSLPQKQDIPNWEYLISLTPNQINTLFTYISKKTLVAALQTAPLEIHQFIAKSISPSVWNEILTLYKATPYSYSESQNGQNEIKKICQELIQKKIL